LPSEIACDFEWSRGAFAVSSNIGCVPGIVGKKIKNNKSPRAASTALAIKVNRHVVVSELVELRLGSVAATASTVYRSRRPGPVAARALRSSPV
jgi:hypothetical protein